jgi:hypothetical protein
MEPMERVSQVIPEVLAAILRKAPLNDEKVAFAWRMAVGATMDKVTTVSLRSGILEVRAATPAWAREVERAAAVVRHRLDTILGQGVVRRIAVIS